MFLYKSVDVDTSASAYKIAATSWFYKKCILKSEKK